jgi:hypothetical protein
VVGICLSSFANVLFNDWPWLQSTETGMDGADVCAAAIVAIDTNRNKLPKLILFIESFPSTDFRNVDPPKLKKWENSTRYRNRKRNEVEPYARLLEYLGNRAWDGLGDRDTHEPPQAQRRMLPP